MTALFYWTGALAWAYVTIGVAIVALRRLVQLAVPIRSAPKAVEGPVLNPRTWRPEPLSIDATPSDEARAIAREVA